MTGEPGAEWSATLPCDHNVDSLAGWALWQSGFKYQSAGMGGVCLRLAVGRSKSLQLLSPLSTS